MHSHNTRGAVTIFFLVSTILHCGLFLFFNYLYQQERTKAKLIAGVELLDLEMPRTVKVTVPKIKRSLLQVLKRKIFRKKTTKIEKPMDVMKKILHKATELKKEKLVDKSDPLLRKMKDMDLDALKRKRDEKLVELTKMAKGNVRKMRDLMSLEAKLTERKSPLHRLGKEAVLEDVGMRRSTESITDVMVAPVKQRKRRSMQSPTLLAKLVEKKEKIQRMLAASSEILDMDKSGSQESGLSVHGIQEFVATKKERRKARELLSIQEVIKEKEGSGGAASRKRATEISALLGRSTGGRGTGGGSPSAMKPCSAGNIETVRVVKKAVPSSMLEKLKRLKRLENLSKVKENPVEISGPIKERGIVSAYLPVYPEWAKKSEIEADVTLRFFVTPGGRVKDVAVEKTSGYRKLDQLTVDSLLNWVFVPLGKGRDQWGIINFKFRLE